MSLAATKAFFQLIGQKEKNKPTNTNKQEKENYLVWGLLFIKEHDHYFFRYF